jgi:hypothetical protein
MDNGTPQMGKNQAQRLMMPKTRDAIAITRSLLLLGLGIGFGLGIGVLDKSFISSSRVDFQFIMT